MPVNQLEREPAKLIKSNYHRNTHTLMQIHLRNFKSHQFETPIWWSSLFNHLDHSQLIIFKKETLALPFALHLALYLSLSI